MIPELTAKTSAALDQRLQVARILAVDAVRPVSGDAEARTLQPASPARIAPVAQGKAALEFAARWPVGATVAARVTGAVEADRILADIDGLPLELHWRGVDGATPAIGQSLAFRVLAVRPEIVLQRLPNGIAEADATVADAPTRISADAKSLQAAATLSAYGMVDDRTLRFTTPLVADHALLEATATHGADAPAAHAAAAATTPAATLEALATTMRTTADPALPFAPVILAGPAWRDQPMELIVRRQRRDERLDDPTQDDWCGELVIDLPHMGRVAGHLAWSMQGLRVRLDADRERSATALTAAAPELAAAFNDLRMRVAALSIGHSAHASGGPDE